MHNVITSTIYKGRPNSSHSTTVPSSTAAGDVSNLSTLVEGPPPAQANIPTDRAVMST